MASYLLQKRAQTSLTKQMRTENPSRIMMGYRRYSPIGSSAIAETGQGLILNVFFSAIVSQFTRNLRVTLQVNQLLPAFLNYCEQRLPPGATLEIKKQKFFSAGYIGSRPTICYFNQDQPGAPFGCVRDSGFIESAVTLFTQYAEELPTMSAEGVTDLAIQAIETYGAEGGTLENNRWPNRCFNCIKRRLSLA